MMKGVRANGNGVLNSKMDPNEWIPLGVRGITVSSIEKVSQMDHPFIHHLRNRLNWNSI